MKSPSVRSIPNIHAHLPDLLHWAQDLADGCETGKLADWDAFGFEVRNSFTSQRMADFERVAPGWGEMAACAGGTTLVHMGAIFTSLLLLPEYQQASDTLRMLSWWTALFHDITKRIRPGKRDYTHGFRSAAAVGLALPRLGFAVQPDYAQIAQDWANLTASAVTRRAGFPNDIQDNSRLPEIMGGLEQLYGADSPGSLVVRTVLLHMSIDLVSDWPQAAPLSPDEERRHVRPDLLPLLKIITLIDSDAWALFDPAVKHKQRVETLAVFKRLEDEFCLC